MAHGQTAIAEDVLTVVFSFALLIATSSSFCIAPEKNVFRETFFVSQSELAMEDHGITVEALLDEKKHKGLRVPLLRAALVGAGVVSERAAKKIGKKDLIKQLVGVWGQHTPAAAGSAPQNGAAGRPAAPRHLAPCACHCAACRAAGHGSACVLLPMGLRRLLHGKDDLVDLVLRHYYGACGWDTARFDAAIRCVQYGPAGDVIAAGDEAGRIHFICAQTGEKILCPLSGHSNPVSSVSWSPDGTKLASGSYDKTVWIWEATTGKQLSQLRGHTDRVWSVCFSPDGTKIASGSHDKTVLIWDAASGEQLCSLRCDSAVLSVAYSADGTKLAAGLGWPSNSVVVFDTLTNEQICSLRGHRYTSSLSKE